jgi:hypothetical protein
MSDTSGRIDWGTTKAKIRSRAYSYVPRERSETKSQAPSGKKILDRIPDVVPARDVVWHPLQSDGKLTEKVFNGSALIPYLKRMAEFIEIAASEGIAGVNKEFDLQAEMPFSILQRKIRNEERSGATTEFDPVAGRAFQIGSTEWAALLLKKGDPMKYKVDKVVEAIRSQPDHALTLSARCVLKIYGERILISLLPEGKTVTAVTSGVKRDFEQKLNTFMNQQSNASVWGSRAIAATIARFTKFLLS